MLDDLQFH